MLNYFKVPCDSKEKAKKIFSRFYGMLKELQESKEVNFKISDGSVDDGDAFAYILSAKCDHFFADFSYHPAFSGKYITFGVTEYERFRDRIDVLDEMGEEHNVPIRSGHFFLFCTDFNNAYAILGKWIVRLVENVLIMEVASEDSIAEYERKLCEEYLSLNEKTAVKAVYYRRFYHCYKAITDREIWLISDQWYRADDNGEALFSYIEKNRKEHQDTYFVLSRNSRDYERVSLIGKVIEPNSFEHRLYRLLADKICSSHVEDVVSYNIYLNANRYYQDILCRGRKVFLQHGITQNNVSNVLGRFSCNLSLLTAGGFGEREGFVHGEYFYDDNIVKLTGLARYDNLVDKNDNIIVIMPTWRNNLAEWDRIDIDGTAVPSKDFLYSPFFLFYNKLLNDETLIENAKKCRYRIKFMPHPNIRPFLHLFQKNDTVDFCPSDTSYKDLFAKGSLLVTDYSSVAFDFAYLEKPVIYCQFDRDFFFSEHYKSGYYDYENDGFGEVLYDLASAIECISTYILKGCKLQEKYRKRIRKFFAYNDRNNCKRIYDEVSKLKETSDFRHIIRECNKQVFFDLKSHVIRGGVGKVKSYRITYRYVFPCHLFKPSDRVIIYGAGKVGLEFYYQNKEYHYLDVVTIIDKEYEKIDLDDLIVEDISVLSSVEYDYVLIAVLNESVAKLIKEDLICFGVENKKIKWDGMRYSWLNFFAEGGFDKLVS